VKSLSRFLRIFVGDGGGRTAALTEPLISDILRALAVTPDQVLQLTPDRVAMLPQDSRCNSWRLGTDARRSGGAQVSTPALMNSRPTRGAQRALWQQICAMNTISTLTRLICPRFGIETRAHAFPWSENLCQQSGRALSELPPAVDGEMAAFAITQVVLDEATLFNIAVDPPFSAAAGRALLEQVIDEVEKRGVVHAVAGSARSMSPPSRSMKA
jgi:DNA polymerase III psi subunit